MAEPKLKRPYDERCEDLARYFMLGTPGATEADIIDLASVLQVDCEDHCSAVEVRLAKEVRNG